jgi:hypothetical protein
LIYSVAEKLNPQNPLDSIALLNATENLFTTTFAAMATTLLFPQASSGVAQKALFSVDRYRLVVVSPVAWIIIVLLIAALLANGYIIYHSTKESILIGEIPTGLLGYGKLVHRSKDLLEFLDQLQEQFEGVEEVRETVKLKYSVDDSKCFIDEETGGIRIKDLDRLLIEVEKVRKQDKVLKASKFWEWGKKNQPNVGELRLTANDWRCWGTYWRPTTPP